MIFELNLKNILYIPPRFLLCFTAPSWSGVETVETTVGLEIKYYSFRQLRCTFYIPKQSSQVNFIYIAPNHNKNVSLVKKVSFKPTLNSLTANDARVCHRCHGGFAANDTPASPATLVIMLSLCGLMVPPPAICISRPGQDRTIG